MNDSIQACPQCGIILPCPCTHQQAEREQIAHSKDVIDKAKETAQEALSGAVVGIVLSVLLLLSLLTNQ